MNNMLTEEDEMMQDEIEGLYLDISKLEEEKDLLKKQNKQMLEALEYFRNEYWLKAGNDFSVSQWVKNYLYPAIKSAEEE